MFYNSLIFIAEFLLPIAAKFSSKVKKWHEGRRQWRGQFEQFFKINQPKRGKILWIHAASLGEFEQGRPIIEAFRERFPERQIVLTFFSPSGFEIRKNYPHANFVAYLPLDSRRNVCDFLDLVQPDLAIFIKYEFWKNYLAELKNRGIPTLLVSAVFRQEQPFFKFYGSMWRKMLDCFSKIFVQDERSRELLQTIDFQNVEVAGDTRIDRVLAIAEAAPRHELVSKFCAADARPIFIVGSSWEVDEAVFLPFFEGENFASFKMILAPHDLRDLSRFDKISDTIFFSQLENGKNLPAKNKANLLIIDNIGLLSSLYQFAEIAYIGGGFGKGIHNILEPAAFGVPIIFGPKFQKFEEARQLLAVGGAFSAKNQTEFELVMRRLADENFRKTASAAARNWLLENRGATEKILHFIS